MAYPSLPEPVLNQALAGYMATTASAPMANPAASAPPANPAAAPSTPVAQPYVPTAQPYVPVAQPVPVFQRQLSQPTAPAQPLLQHQVSPSQAFAPPPMAQPVAPVAYNQAVHGARPVLPAYGTPQAGMPQAAPYAQPAYAQAPDYTQPVQQLPSRVAVQESPSGFGGGVLGGAIGTLACPVIGTVIGAFVGRQWQRSNVAAQRTVYVRPSPTDTPVPVKLWKLGETAPMTDAGFQLVLEARNIEQMEKFLMRVIRHRGGIVMDGKALELHAAHVIAMASGDQQTLPAVLNEVSQQPWCRGLPPAPRPC